MFACGRTSCSEAAKRGRAAVLWVGLLFLVAQVGIDLALSLWSPLRDPEYGWRLHTLRARIAERTPGRPLLLLLGSSRVALGVRPGLLRANQAGPSAGPVVFNFGLCRSGPVMELVCLRRLLADGIRPDVLFVEVWPPLWAAPADAQMAIIQSERLGEDDAAVLRPYLSAQESALDRWRRLRLVPWLAYRVHLLNQVAPSWVGPTKRFNEDWDGLDDWGWLNVARMQSNDAGTRARTDWVRTFWVGGTAGFRPADDSRRAFGELHALCRREGIGLVLLAMLDAFRADYPTDVRGRMDALLYGLSAEYGVPLIDARAWSPAEDFYDGVHLTHGGAAAFTERFGREVLQPYLEGKPSSRLRLSMAR